jgi:hypothetical protein
MDLIIYDIHALQERFYFGDNVIPVGAPLTATPPAPPPLFHSFILQCPAHTFTSFSSAPAGDGERRAPPPEEDGSVHGGSVCAPS